MSSATEKIKERLDIVDVVGAYLKLQKAGVNFKACCPFHNEKTPSFFVSPARGTYHCFGCNKGGDIFSFVEEMEGLDFKGALKILADKAGVELEFHKQDPKEKEKRARLYELLESATLFYQINLTKNKDALAYLYKRGLKPETLKSFRLGFAPCGWENCRNFLKSKGFSDEEMERSGMIIKKSDDGAYGNSYYDRFRSRIIFPINDSAGRTIAFSGRIFGKDDDKSAKYVNSPETELFHKSNILFGYDMAKSEMRRENKCILVEGQMDLIMAHQCGFANTVAVSGTAFTEKHARNISRMADTLILSLDADSAGLSATKRAALIALEEGLDVRVASLPEGKDPADVLAEDTQQYKSAIEKSEHIVDFYMNILSKKFPDMRSFKLEAVKIVLPIIAQIKNKVDREHFISCFSKKISTSEDVVREEMQKIPKANVQIQRRQSLSVSAIGAITKNRKEIIEKKILGIIFLQDCDKEPGMHIKELKKRFEKMIGKERYDALLKISDEEKQKLIFEAEVYTGGENLISKSDDLFLNLELEILKEKREVLSENIQRDESSGKGGDAQNLLKEFQKISEEISKIEDRK